MLVTNLNIATYILLFKQFYINPKLMHKFKILQNLFFNKMHKGNKFSFIIAIPVLINL